MSSITISADLTPEAFKAVIADKSFRLACETLAREAVEYYLELSPDYQWTMKDLGRTGICITAAVLHYADSLTVQSLTAACTANKVASPGRVHQFVRRLQGMDQFEVKEGAGLWTRRRARLGARLLEMLRRRGLIDMKAAVALKPELHPVLALMDTDEGSVSFTMFLAAVTSQRRDLFAFAGNDPVDHFMHAEAGMLMLFDLLASQAPNRERLLEQAPLSRSRLSRRYGVSRAHINKLLADSGEAEAVGDHLAFTERLSQSLQAHFALIFRLNLDCAEALLGGWRYQPSPAPRRSLAK